MMGLLGRIKRYAKRSYHDWRDSKAIANLRYWETVKFQDPRRVAIYSTINLTKEQQQQIDDFYITNYGEKIPYTWHRHFTAFTGNFDYKYFPELIYIPEFEYFMNSRRDYVEVLSNKNILPLIAEGIGIKTPRVILSRACGVYRDNDYRCITENDAAAILRNAGEVFIKPAVATRSGTGCEVINVGSVNEAAKIFERLGSDFVVQERLRCHEDIARIYAGSVNTFRIITYIWHGEVRHGLSVIRIGRGGNYLDNAHAGGMFVAIDEDGTLHTKAFTEFKIEFTEHPDTGTKFAGWKIRGFPEVLKAAERMHGAIPQVGVINWDFTIGEDGSPVLIEGNMYDGGIWIFQMAHGKGPFGDDTAEILQWTRKMKGLKLSQRLHKKPLLCAGVIFILLRS